MQVSEALQDLESQGHLLARAFCRQAAEAVPEEAPPGCSARLQEKQTGMDRWAWAHAVQRKSGVGDQAAAAGVHGEPVTGHEARLGELQRRAEALLQALLDSNMPDDDRG
jgi:hypothetical protein